MVKKFIFFLLPFFLIFIIGISQPVWADCQPRCNESWQEIKNNPNADNQEYLKILCNGPNCNTCSFCTIGTISLPSFFKYGSVEGGLGKFLNNIFMLITAGAGIFALFNFIMAGYAYMSANGDKEKIEQAWSKIWQSVIGLTIVAGAFLIAALAGWILFGDPSFILKPKIYGPN